MFLMVVAGSVTTIGPKNCARTGQAAIDTTATLIRKTCATLCRIYTSPDDCQRNLRLSPRAEIVPGSTHQTRAGSPAVRQGAQPHVHGGCLAIAHAFAARQQLFECVRKQLIRGDVLPSGQHFASSDFVENGSEFVIARPRIDDIILKFLDGLLHWTAVASHQRDLIACNLR